MDEYISTKDLDRYIQSWVNEVKYYHPYAKPKQIPFDELKDILERIPKTKIEEIVRCEECDHVEIQDTKRGKNYICTCEDGLFSIFSMVNPEGYCYRGIKTIKGEEK